MEYILKLKNYKIYIDDRLLLNIENFQVKEGDYICIQGENGTGKSTLLKAIGLQLDRKLIVKGNVIWNNQQEIKDISYFKNYVVFINQTPEFMDYNGTLKSELKMLLGNKEYNRRFLETKNFFDYYLGEGEYEKTCNKKLSKYNEGHKKILYILIKIYTHPDLKLLLVDEPLNHLDHKFAPKINKLFNEIISRKNTAIVFISHCRMFVNPNKAYIIDKMTKKVQECIYKSENSCFGCIDKNGNYIEG